jgi:hypothetical protein
VSHQHGGKVQLRVTRGSELTFETKTLKERKGESKRRREVTFVIACHGICWRMEMCFFPKMIPTEGIPILRAHDHLVNGLVVSKKLK